MKYLMFAAIAGALVACSDAPDDDRMEEGPERGYDTPEMSGEYEEMRAPVDEVNPPGEVIPESHEIVGDSVIVPQEDAMIDRTGTDPIGTDPAVSGNDDIIVEPKSTDAPSSGAGEEGTMNTTGTPETTGTGAPEDGDEDTLIEVEPLPEDPELNMEPVMPEDGMDTHHSPDEVDPIDEPVPANPE